MVNVGDAAPDLRLSTADDVSIALHDVIKGGRNVVLVFLRHLG